jgi:hypothetical protein
MMILGQDLKYQGSYGLLEYQVGLFYRILFSLCVIVKKQLDKVVKISYNKVRKKDDEAMKEFIKILLCFFFGCLFALLAMFAWVGFETICM